MRSFRIAAWNIRKAVGLDWKRNPDRILSAIAALEADVVALQEADQRLWDRPSALPRARIQAETGLIPVDAGNGRSLGWHGNAILAAPDFAVHAVHRLDLPGLEPRGALLADLSRGGAELRVVSVHLGLARRHRRGQLARLTEWLADLPARPTVILGDFNEWSRNKGVEPLSATFTTHAPGPSFHAARPVAALDRIAHDAQLALRASGVHRCDFSARASDHLPIWADLEQAPA